MIRVLVVDDSPAICHILKKQLSKDPEIEVVGIAADPYEARDLLVKLNPDVMTLDIEMPKMDGLEFLKKLLPQFPIPTLIVSSLSTRKATIILEAMESGAISFIAKPNSMGDPSLVDNFFKELIENVKIAAQTDLSKIKNPKFDIHTVAKGKYQLEEAPSNKLILIGASTGGTTAVTEIIKQLPSNMPPIVVVQHMPEGFTVRFAERLNEISEMKVVEAKNNQILKQGTVYIAPAGIHSKLVRHGSEIILETFDGEKLHGVKPAVDYLFKSAAEFANSGTIGVILTGMGRDGADGLYDLYQKGAYTIAQDKESSLIWGMPAQAIEKGGAKSVLPLDQIPNQLIKLVWGKRKDEN